MSFRLHVGPTESKAYDCVVTSKDHAEERVREWVKLTGPWKISISIGNVALFKELQPILMEAFDSSAAAEYPDNIWAFYYGEDGNKIEHPTAAELELWVKGLEP